MRGLVLSVLAIGAAASSPAAAQPPGGPPPGGQPPAPVKSVPLKPVRLADGHLNLSGFWVLPGGMLEVDFGPSGVTNRGPATATQNVPQAPPPDTLLKSPYKEQYEITRQAMAKGELPDFSALCIPNGMPRMMGMIYGMEIIQGPNVIAITSEYQGTTRRIWMDEKAHPPPDEIDETYSGHSIGHWEKDVLVVDTVGIRQDTPMDGQRRPHSPKLRIIERFTQASPGVLVDDITIEDPDALIAPIKQSRTYKYRPDLKLREYSCADNNRNVDPVTGKAAFK